MTRHAPGPLHEGMRSHTEPMTKSDSTASEPRSSTDENSPPSLASSTSFLASTLYSGFGLGGLLRRLSSDPDGHSLMAPSAGPGYGPGDGIGGVYNPTAHLRRGAPSPMRAPPLDPLVLSGFRPDTPASARLLTPTVAEEIRIMLPERLKIEEDWRLVYSLDGDGSSLGTLYKKCSAYEGRRGGFVLVVRDDEGGTFGAYLSEYPHPSPNYFGTGECFLWRASMLASLPPPPSADTTHLTGRSATIASSASASASSTSLPSIRFKAFPYSGVNEYYVYCDPRWLSVGAGDGKYGLWLDDNLEKGISSTCLTFGNEPLSDEGEKFGVLGVEVWVIGAKDR